MTRGNIARALPMRVLEDKGIPDEAHQQASKLYVAALALEAIAFAGPGRTYRTDPHTPERCRAEFFKPRLLVRKGINDWQMKGNKSIGEAALSAWQPQLAQHQVPPPEPANVRQLDHYVEAHA